MRNLKRVLSVLLSAAMLLSLTAGLSLTAYADDYVSEEGFVYSILADGTVQIEAYQGTEENLIIPEQIDEKTVTSLGGLHGHKSWNKRFVSVTMPDTVTKVRMGLFSSCKYLKNVKFSKSITAISDSMFSNCASLETIVIPNNITSIGDMAFSSCKNLKNVTIPDSVTTLNGRTFVDCISLEEIVIPSSITYIPYLTFDGCTNLKEVVFPDTLTRIGHDVFKDCTSLESILVLSKNCDFTGTSIPSNTTIYGFKNSTAETYANENGNEFISLGEEKLATPNARVLVNKNGTFLISWSYVQGAGLYEVYMYDNDEGVYTLKYTTEKCAIKTEFSEYGCTYKYKVRAVSAKNSKYVSDFSNEVEGLNLVKLSTPTLEIKVNSDASFTLSWDEISGANYYEIYCENADGSYSRIQTLTDHSAKIGAVYGKTCTYKVRACSNENTSAKSDFSASVSAVNNKKLLKPGIKNIAVNVNGTFTLNWEKITGADKYEVYMYDSATKTYKLFQTVTDSTTLTTTARVFGRNYFFKVRALKNGNDAVTSDFGPSKSAVNNKKLMKPGIKNITVNSNGSFTLNWEKITGADKYEIYYSTDGGKTYKLYKSVAGATTYTTGVAYRYTYTYKVRAVKNGNSAVISDFGPAKSVKR